MRPHYQSLITLFCIGLIMRKNYAQYVEYITINHLTNLALNKLDQEQIITEINSRINSNKKPSIKKRALVFTNVAYVLCSLVIIVYLFSAGESK